jgi:DNA-directed RNA polymerase specialized sigma subunit|nr:MAG TPA: Protein of unknown function (DUF2481) [Caudoviricetes sp.]
MNKLLSLDFYKDILEPLNNKNIKTAELAATLGVSTNELEQYIKDYGFQWIGSQYHQNNKKAAYIEEYLKLAKEKEQEENKINILKKDMVVDLEKGSIEIPTLGSVDIQLIIAAYERVKQAQGIEAAKNKGDKYKGRKPLEMPDNFKEYLTKVAAKELTAVEAAAALNISRASYYRLKEKVEKG